MARKSNRKSALIAALAVLVVALAVGGTIAWLTAQDRVTNTFTIGNFSNPDTEPKPDDPGTEEDEDKDSSNNSNTGGYLFETNWPLADGGATDPDYTPKLTPGVAQAKNPNVGIGAGSDDAYVFIYVVNNSLDSSSGGDLDKDAPYFKIEKQWAAVTGDGATGVTPTLSTAVGVSGAYVDGLFMYVENNSDSLTEPAILTVDGDADVYTGELFETITMPDGVDTRKYSANPNIEVYAFIYGGNPSADGTDGTAAGALAAAIEWATKIKDGA